MTKSKNCNNCSESDSSSKSNSLYKHLEHNVKHPHIHRRSRSNSSDRNNRNRHSRSNERNNRNNRNRHSRSNERNNRNRRSRSTERRTKHSRSESETSNSSNHSKINQEHKLEKNLNKYKQDVQVAKDQVIMFEFLKHKMEASFPLFSYCKEQFTKRSIQHNRKWIEHFVERLLCALSQKDVFNNITLKYKKKHVNEYGHRQYVITTKYENKKGKLARHKFKLNLLWNKNNKNNDSNIYRNILSRAIQQIDKELLVLKAETIKPYLL